MAEVVVDYGGKEILRLPLKGSSMVIGRDPQCDLHLDNRALSRRHALIEKRGAAIWVKDLNSQNGTFVNGERVSEAGQVLNGGDAIEVGRYRVHIDGVEEARTDTPVLTLDGPEGRHRFAMVGDEIIIGRAPSCDIAIGHKSISRRHVRIALEGGQFIAEDLGSQNGSRINNRRINGPTPFRVGDKVQMSEFTIEVGYLETPKTSAAGPQKSGRTMMINREDLANVAHINGDLQNPGGNVGNISIGQPQLDGGEDGPSIAVDEAPVPPVRPPMPANPPAPAHGGKAKKPPPPQVPLVAVTHPDLAERDVMLNGDVTVLGEDGNDGDSTEGRAFAAQGAIALIRTPRGVVATVVGDRRLLVVNGQPQLVAQLQEGDTLELGVLTVVFHEPD